jgi:tetratricopeptide (TPR) repeat protein
VSADPLAVALQLAQAGRLDDAMQHCERVLAMRPTHAAALSLAGVIALRMGNAETAARRLSLAASVEPRNASHHFNLGEALSLAGRHAEAAEAYRRAIRIEPRNARAQSGLAFALQALGNAAESLDTFARAASLDRKAVDIQMNYGVALQRAGRIDEALPVLRQAAALAPNVAETHFNLGVALAARNDLDDAAAAYEAALRLAPDHTRALNNLGRIAEARGEREAALLHYARACERAPDFAEAWYNRANMLKELGRYGEAVQAYDRALALRPDSKDALKNRGLVRLTLGDFAGGWSDHRAREAPRAGADQPAEALPADFSGERILILREQGVGDEIFFLRFAPLLAARGATVSAIVDPRLVDMLARTGKFSDVFSAGQETGPFDRRLLMADLPFLLGHARAEDCPPALPIPPVPASLDKMRARLEAAGPAPRIAVTWRAGVPGSTLRQIPPAPLGAALSATHGTVVLVQRKPDPGDVAAFTESLGRPAADLSDANDDLEDMLALMSLADRYVSVSNTNVHLRASVGPVSHVLVPHPPEWRWFAEGPSPWFPEARIYRQTSAGDWHPALAQLARDVDA